MLIFLNDWLYNQDNYNIWKLFHLINWRGYTSLPETIAHRNYDKNYHLIQNREPESLINPLHQYGIKKYFNIQKIKYKRYYNMYLLIKI